MSTVVLSGPVGLPGNGAVCMNVPPHEYHLREEKETPGVRHLRFLSL